MKIELEPSDIELIAEKITLRLSQTIKTGFVPAVVEDDDTVYTVETLAKYLQTTTKWVYNHITELPHFKLDGLIRFRKTIIDQHFDHKKIR